MCATLVMRTVDEGTRRRAMEERRRASLVGSAQRKGERGGGRGRGPRERVKKELPLVPPLPPATFFPLLLLFIHPLAARGTRMYIGCPSRTPRAADERSCHEAPFPSCLSDRLHPSSSCSVRPSSCAGLLCLLADRLAVLLSAYRYRRSVACFLCFS